MKRITAIILSMTLTLGMTALLASSVYAGEYDWNVDLTKTSGNSSLGYTAYRSMQGVGFDTYSGKDGYEFVQSDDKKKFSLIHFTMDSKGWCIRVKKVLYNATNLGHANDITIFKDESGVKWLIFAPCGSSSETNTAKASDGSKLTLGAIKLAEYNKGTAKVYGCNTGGVVSTNITGVTYKGKEYINGQKVPVFIILSGSTLYEASLIKANGKLTFKATGKTGKIQKPTLYGSTLASAQGITYHNHYVYMAAEGSGDYATRTIVARISTEDLFDGNTSPKAMEVFDKNIKKIDAENANFTKHAPEAVFFTSLNKKSNMYVGLNRTTGGKDNDAIMRSAIRY